MAGYSGNFGFLAEHSPLLARLGHAAEQVFSSDPNTTLIKLRQLGEAIAQEMATRSGIVFDRETTQADLLYKLQREIQLDPEIRSLFHTLRIEGNKATHQFQTRHREAMDGLKVARSLAIWYHQSVGKQGTAFKPGPFAPPQDPSTQLRDLQTQIEQLKASLGSATQALENNQQLADLVGREKEEYAVLAQQMDVEACNFEALARQREAELQQAQRDFETQLKAIQQQLDSQKAQRFKTRTRQASRQFSHNEELTRILIDVCGSRPGLVIRQFKDVALKQSSRADVPAQVH
jgi:type I restriction enzyme R subunit